MKLKGCCAKQKYLQVATLSLCATCGTIQGKRSAKKRGNSYTLYSATQLRGRMARRPDQTVSETRTTTDSTKNAYPNPAYFRPVSPATGTENQGRNNSEPLGLTRRTPRPPTPAHKVEVTTDTTPHYAVPQQRTCTTTTLNPEWTWYPWGYAPATQWTGQPLGFWQQWQQQQPLPASYTNGGAGANRTSPPKTPDHPPQEPHDELATLLRQLIQDQVRVVADVGTFRLEGYFTISRRDEDAEGTRRGDGSSQQDGNQ